MHINELLVDPVEDDGISLRDFTEENLSDDMAELLGHLKAAESWGQVRVVLSLYCCVEDGSVE